MDYMDELKGKLPKFKIIDKGLRPLGLFGMIVEARQMPTNHLIYEVKIGVKIWTFHHTQLQSM